MHLTPREIEKLMLHNAGTLAQKVDESKYPPDLFRFIVFDIKIDLTPNFVTVLADGKLGSQL